MDNTPEQLYLFPAPANHKPPKWIPGAWLHVLLFVLTFLSSWLTQGLVFAVVLMSILLAHEMGHYITARYYAVDQSLPYFIPAPTLFGTLGAVIVMRSQPPSRDILLKIACMGPYAGLVLAIPAAAWGLMHSIPINDSSVLEAGYIFGDSILFKLLEYFFSPNGTDVILHPVAQAGWVGLFITSLNLIPAAQLDGGHIAYALFGKHHEQISLAVAVGLILFGLIGMSHLSYAGSAGSMWVVWGVLLLVMGLHHPPVQHGDKPLAKQDVVYGVLALLIFVITFIPVPIEPFEHAPQEMQQPEEFPI